MRVPGRAYSRLGGFDEAAAHLPDSVSSWPAYATSSMSGVASRRRVLGRPANTLLQACGTRPRQASPSRVQRLARPAAVVKGRKSVSGSLCSARKPMRTLSIILERAAAGILPLGTERAAVAETASEKTA
jgi:hypothetical protein